MHILDKPLDLPEQGADKVLSGASKVGRRDRGHAKNPVFSQFLLSDGTPLITSKSVCQQPVRGSSTVPGRSPSSRKPTPAPGTNERAGGGGTLTRSALMRSSASSSSWNVGMFLGPFSSRWATR